MKNRSLYISHAALCILFACMTMSACGPIPVNVNGKTMYIGGDKKDTASKNNKGPTAALSAKINKKADATIVIPRDNVEPRYETAVKVDGTVLRMREQGFKACGDAWGVGKPIAKIEIKHEQILTVRFKEQLPRQNPAYTGMMLMTPGNKYFCAASTNGGVTRRFDAGTYYVYSTWNGVKSNNHKRPGEAYKGQGTVVVTTLGKKSEAPTFELTENTTNPWRAKEFVYIGSFIKPDAVGLSKCRSYRTSHSSGTPIARIKISKPGEHVFNIYGNAGVALKNEAGDYWCGSLSKPRKWKTGTYSVYALVGRQTAEAGKTLKFKAEAYNTKTSPTMVGEIPTYKIGDMPAPMVIKGKTFKNRYVKAYDCGKNQFFSTQPDFYIELDKPLKKVNLRLLDRASKKMSIAIVDVTKNDKILFSKKRSCRRNRGYITAGEMNGTKLRKADGKYAIYIAHPGGANKSEPYTFIVNTHETKIDPFFKTVDIPADLKAEQRIMKYHYPFMSRISIGWNQTTRINAWERIDPNLVVYATKAIEPESASRSYRKPKDEGKLVLKPGEPLILLGVKARRKSGDVYKYTVMTSDLFIGVITADALSASKPAQLAMPKKPRKYETFTTQTMMPHADKRAQSDVAKYDKVYKKYDDCFDAYWSKHGGGTASRYNRITRKGGRIVQVKNMGKIIRERANRKCGVKRMESFKAKRDKSVYRSFEAKRASMLKAINVRLSQ